MSFGGGFGGSGFGSSANNNTTFGGFGASSTNTGGFGGTNNNTTGFGTTNNTTGSLFGGGTAGGGFGTSNNNTSAFGQQNKPAFGAATGGGIFGNNNNNATTTSAFGGGGGFGASNTSTSAFGGGNTGGGLFGANNNNKSAFGTTTTGGGLFGGSGTTNTAGGFGTTANNTTGGGLFGGQGATAFGQVGEAQGTGGTRFEPWQEKETTSGITNHFQSITFMNPYVKHSFEELRLADYQRGQKQGTAFGQTGFAANNNQTGGFGNTQTTGGLFGGTAATTSSTPFGGTATAGSGFGTGGGLFGQNKPATGGLFGASNTTPAANTGGGLFGGNNAATGTTGFGQQSTGGGLFGANNNNAPKPGGLFGGGATTGSTGGFGGFGTGAGTAASNTGGGLFGNAQNQTAGGFGNTQANPNPFGQQQNNAANPFGGAQQQKSLFNTTANTATGGGLFGNTQPAQNTGGLFGNAGQQQAQTGGLFGQQQNKPAAGGLFGGNTGGSNLFGNTQPAQNTGGLFGNAQQNQQQNAGGGLFGNQPNQNAGSSLFGNPQQVQNQGSLFGAANSTLASQQPAQNPLQAPTGFQASLNDPSPYGSASIFHGLPPPPQNSPGPIATPIASGSIKNKKVAALPQYKLNPVIASRLMTPQKRGYGFSYSTYGTPSSTTSTPGGLGSSLMGGSLGRSLGKSLSTSNLRGDGEPTSILAPGAFSAGSQRYSATGSLKRLTIDRGLRTDLFASSTPPPALPPAASTRPVEDLRGSALKKKVSFDTTTVPENGTAATATHKAQEQGYLRSSTTINGGGKSAQTNGDDVTETVVQGNELAIVPEDSSPEAVRNKSSNIFEQADPQPGAYWIEPSAEELRKLSKTQLKSVSKFRIGRENCGFVAFDEPVDLSNIDLDDIADKIAIIELRSLTVYPDNTYKPPVGKGLNVPSTITLENSWPRSRDRRTPSYDKSGPRFNKHVERLKRVPDTEFIDYNKDNGEWTFRVPHFTTYGLEYDEDEESMVSEALNESTVSQAPPTPTPKGKQVRSTPTPITQEQPSSSTFSARPSDQDVRETRQSSVRASQPRTLESKRARIIPGGFDEISGDEEEASQETEMMEDGPGGLAVRADTPESNASEEEPKELDTPLVNEVRQMALVPDEDLTMAGTFPDPQEESDEDISRFSVAGTPMRFLSHHDDDWADRLQRTVSPRKQDRQLLKQSQAVLDNALIDIDTTPTHSTKQTENHFDDIKTSVDLMRSLFGKEELRRSGHKSTKAGFQWPYKKHNANSEQSEMDEKDIAFHQSFKPSFAVGNQLILRKDDVRVLRAPVLIPSSDRGHLDIERLQRQTSVSVKNNVPAAELRPLPFKQVQAIRPASSRSEAYAYELLSILFDHDEDDDLFKDIPESERPQYAHRIRKDKLSNFWAALCEPEAMKAVKNAKTAEDKAIAYLSMHKVAEACDALAVGKDYRLATLIAQIGGDQVQRDGMNKQLESWAKSNSLSEFDDAIRTLYSLVAGETCRCEGKSGPVEDRVKTFVISDIFGLDWVRSFGLKLWYGVLPEDSLETAVAAFAADLASGKEQARPDPRVLRSSSTSSWQDPHPDSRQDMLWSILTLVAEKNQVAAKTRLPAALSPENVLGNPTSFRMSFELYQMLAPRLPRAIEPVKADALTIAFSAELESLGDWKYAVFVLMFIDDPVQRGRALQTCLARISPQIDHRDEANLTFLFKTLRMPESWFWNAKALESRAAGNKSHEVVFLARGHNWVESHRVLCEDVAPLAVIEREHTRLRTILEQFPEKSIAEWRLGGQVFEDYLVLLEGKIGSPEQSVVLQNLLAALAELKPRPGDRRKLTFAQSVALGEMSKLAAQKARELGGAEDGKEIRRLMALPSTEEVRRQEMIDLGMQHFRAAMAQ